MKKILFASAILLATGIKANAQLSSIASKASSAVSTAKTASSLASLTGMTPKSIASTLVKNELKSKLGLSTSQVPKVTSAVTAYATAKEKITSLKSTNASAYKTKQSSLLTSLKSNLATTLTKNQLSKFTSLQSTTSSTSALSYLFQ